MPRSGAILTGRTTVPILCGCLGCLVLGAMLWMKSMSDDPPATFQGRGAAHWKKQIQAWKHENRYSAIWGVPDFFLKNGEVDVAARPVLLELLDDADAGIRI